MEYEWKREGERDLRTVSWREGERRRHFRRWALSGRETRGVRL